MTPYRVHRGPAPPANVWQIDHTPTVSAGSDWGPALQALAGVKYEFSEKMDVGLGYKYLVAYSEKLSGDEQARFSSIQNHTISLTFTYHF